jgi:hypothetical protein
MKPLLAGLAAIPLALGLLVYATGLAIVDVREGGPDGTHLIVPVPLALANVGLLFVHQKHQQVDCAEFAPYREAALRLARELRRAPDARFVEVEDSQEHVTVDKVGDILVVEVHDGDEDVLVRVPLAALEKLAESYDGKSFHAVDVLAAIRKAPVGEVVRVHDGDDQVRVWIW